ncbi:MAG TPA: hydroxymethylbilane synthase [Chthoniobacterales bacterium]|jgi:hydroxymethylbilane synthase
MKPFVIGTRNSALALAQTHLFEAAVRAAFPELPVEVREITTTGDQRLDLSLTDAAGKLDKGLFTKELEEALLDGRIDAAVHSLKDLPTILPPGLALAAVLPRANVDDWLISKRPGGFAALAPGASVATSSIRRQLQLKARRPDLEIVEIRGNVATRLRKLGEHPDWSATVLAAAGVERLGLVKDGRLGDFYISNLTPEVTLPAVGQGAIGIEVREGASEYEAVFRAINHQPTWDAISLERALLRALGGGCQTPLGVRSSLVEEGWRLDAVLHRGAREIRVCGTHIADLAATLLS